MKKTLLFSAALILCTSLLAQVPQGISHQAVIRNTQGELVTGQNIGVRVSILQGSAEGTAVFVETHTPQSNPNGLITYVIGQGTLVSGSFEDIDWADRPYFLKTEADPEGNDDYTITGTTQFLSVPYAMHAGSSSDNQWEQQENDIFFQGGKVGIGTTIPNFQLDVNGAITSRLSNGFRLRQSTYGFILRNDNNSLWALVTDPDDPDGNYNSLRPLRIELETGDVKLGNVLNIQHGGNMGIGTEAPTQKLDINGQIRIRGGSPGVGKVLTSNSNGTASWEADGLSLPYDQQAEFGEVAFRIINTSTELSATGGSFHSAGESGRGIVGFASSSDGTNYGVYGSSNSNTGIGVFGIGGTGVSGRSTKENGTGIYGWASGTGQTTGVYGRTGSSDGRAVFGYASSTSGSTYGVYGFNASSSGYGLYGYASSTSGSTYGVYGFNASSSGYGVYGYASSTTGQNYGVLGFNSSSEGAGVYGKGGIGGHFITDYVNSNGVKGESNAEYGSGNGVYGFTKSEVGAGVFGESMMIGVKGKGLYAVYAIGDMYTTGNYNSKKDHPLDPANKYLLHFTSESSEPLNVYSGNIDTDAQGFAMVKLPDYFETISRDYRYQLTVIDDSEDFVLAKVNREIQNNQFEIRTSKPFVKVSWRIEALRNDLLIQKQGFESVVDKPIDHRGKYLHPELYGMPEEKGIHYNSPEKMPERKKAVPIEIPELLQSNTEHNGTPVQKE